MSLILSGTDGLSDVDGSAATPAIRGTDANTGIFFPAADTIAFSEGGVESMRIDSSGNVGIGTSSPSYPLQINRSGVSSYLANTDGTGTLLSGVNGSGLGVYGTFSNTAVAFFSNSTERMRIDSSGNVGIGTSSPSSKLHVAGTGFVSDTFQVSGTATAVNSNGIGLEFRGGSTPSVIAYSRVGSAYLPMTNSASLHTWDTSGTERMRIESSYGALLIGLTTASTTLYQEIKYTTSYTGTRYINTSSSFSTAIDFVASSVQVGRITTSGTATTYSTSSDYRLKENIAPMTGALAKVAQLKPCTYTWKANGSNGEGFIAHELQEICPDAVVGEKDAVNKDGSIKPQGIDTSFLVATLTAAIQELNAKVEAQAAEIALLKSK